MRAIRFDRFGSPSELQVQDVTKPEPKEGEVLIQVQAASVNPSDVKNIQGSMKTITTLPRIPGRDFAGVVIAGAQDWIDIIIDTVGGDMALKALSTLSPRGRLTEISVPPKQQQVNIDLLNFYRRQLRLLGVNSLDWDAQGCADILEALTPGFEKNALHFTTPIQSYKLAEASKAHEQVLARSNPSKVVLKP